MPLNLNDNPAKCIYLRAILRDIDDPKKMEAWKYAVLHTSFHYKVAKEDEIFWLVQNNRQHKKSDGITMSLTCLQRIFSILNHKQRHEKLHGEISPLPLKPVIRRFDFSCSALTLSGVENFCKLYETKFKHATEAEKA